MSRAILGALMALVLSAAAADAGVSITNRDDKGHKLTVIEGEAKADHVLKPAQVLEGICQQGCIIRLNDSEDDEYELEGSEVVSIEEGFLYYDGPEAPSEGQAAPQQGSGGEAPKPGQKQ
ncbi:MAG: hypothetical protein ACM31O_15215 [Bacteroidota bacterium]